MYELVGRGGLEAERLWPGLWLLAEAVLGGLWMCLSAIIGVATVVCELTMYQDSVERAIAMVNPSLYIGNACGERQDSSREFKHVAGIVMLEAGTRRRCMVRLALTIILDGHL